MAKQKTIKLTLTIQETQWLRDSMSVAASAYAEANADGLRKWAIGMAKGLDAKIEEANKG